jgi:hypothetical protein
MRIDRYRSVEGTKSRYLTVRTTCGVSRSSSSGEARGRRGLPTKVALCGLSVPISGYRRSAAPQLPTRPPNGFDPRRRVAVIVYRFIYGLQVSQNFYLWGSHSRYRCRVARRRSSSGRRRSCWSHPRPSDSNIVGEEVLNGHVDDRVSAPATNSSTRSSVARS